MTRHVLDKPRKLSGSVRAARFLRMERQLGRSQAARALHERPKLTGSGRLRQFLRIERGRTA